MGSLSPASTDTSESGSHEELVEHEFGYPLQRMVPLESMQVGGEESPLLPGLYRMPASQSSSTSSHTFYVNFEAVVDEFLSHYKNSDTQDMVIVEADASAPSERSTTALILRRVKLHSTELALLRSLNADEIRSDPWNPAPRLLYTAERGDTAVLCLERLFDCDHPPLQTIANVVDYIRQSLEGLCFLHEHKIAHCAYGEPTGVMMDIGRSTSAGFDRTRLPVRYYRVDFSRAMELTGTREADPRSASYCRDVRDCGAMLQTLVEEVPKIGRKLRSLVLAMTGGEYGAEDARKLFEALCKGIDASTYDAPLHIP